MSVNGDHMNVTRMLFVLIQKTAMAAFVKMDLMVTDLIAVFYVLKGQSHLGEPALI